MEIDGAPELDRLRYAWKRLMAKDSPRNRTKISDRRESSPADGQRLGVELSCTKLNLNNVKHGKNLVVDSLAQCIRAGTLDRRSSYRNTQTLIQCLRSLKAALCSPEIERFVSPRFALTLNGRAIECWRVHSASNGSALANEPMRSASCVKADKQN